MIIDAFESVNDSLEAIKESGGRRYIVILNSGIIGLTSEKQRASSIEKIVSLLEDIVLSQSLVGLRRRLQKELSDYQQILE
jgi:hypothetical protein